MKIRAWLDNLNLAYIAIFWSLLYLALLGTFAINGLHLNPTVKDFRDGLFLIVGGFYLVGIMPLFGYHITSHAKTRSLIQSICSIAALMASAGVILVITFLVLVMPNVFAPRYVRLSCSGMQTGFYIAEQSGWQDDDCIARVPTDYILYKEDVFTLKELGKATRYTVYDRLDSGCIARQATSSAVHFYTTSSQRASQKFTYFPEQRKLICE